MYSGSKVNQYFKPELTYLFYVLIDLLFTSLERNDTFSFYEKIEALL